MAARPVADLISDVSDVGLRQYDLVGDFQNSKSYLSIESPVVSEGSNSDVTNLLLSSRTGRGLGHL